MTPSPSRTAGAWSLALLLSIAACGAEPPDTTPSTSSGGGGASTTSSTHTLPPTSVGGGGTGGGGGSGGGDVAPPVASASGDGTVRRGSVVHLHGWGFTSDPGGIIEYDWTQVSGTPVALDDPMIADPTFVAPMELGTLVFSLTVYDSQAGSAPAEVTITVANRAPVVTAGPDKGALAGETVTLEGQGVDQDGDPLTFAWTQIMGPPVPLSDPTSPTPTLVLPAGLAEPLVFALTASDDLLSSEPDWVTVRRLDGPDSDGDLLEDSEELALGTDPLVIDSDGDGIPDGWEVLGHEGVDYPALGCDPLHKDLLVELAVQEYEDNGVLHTARPSPVLRQALSDFYAALPVTSPDGAPGIALHLVDGSILDASFVCPAPFAPIPEDLGNPLHREAFHTAILCYNGGGGFADIGGHRFWVGVPLRNDDPSDDLTEEAAFGFYTTFVHEMGHNLGLEHGGKAATNYKPNYPSIMNYAYSHGIGGAHTISDAVVGFSHGLLPSLDECALVEQGAFAGIPVADLAFLGVYEGTAGPWTATADGSVDWNHDGTLSAAPATLVLHDGTGCELLGDHDDFPVIAEGLAQSIPAAHAHQLPSWVIARTAPPLVWGAP